jgi:NADPH-dependent ferric siderophore reductase
MAKRLNCKLNVINKAFYTPNMIRIILGGDDLKEFPEGFESGYVKLLFDQGGEKPLTRSYTIRAFDKTTYELTLDFVVHEDGGPASTWATNASVGDSINISGPGPAKLVDFSADWFFIAGDMTALPAMSVNLEKLPKAATGYAVIEIIDEADKIEIDLPENIEVHWVVNPHPHKENTVLADAVKALPWKEGVPNVWVASEFEAMRSLRHYFKKERGVGRGQIYASSYWKIGETDEGNKRAKRLDAEAE